MELYFAAFCSLDLVETQRWLGLDERKRGYDTLHSIIPCVSPLCLTELSQKLCPFHIQSSETPWRCVRLRLSRALNTNSTRTYVRKQYLLVGYGCRM